MRSKGRPAQGHQIQSRILHRSQFIHRRRIICTDFRTGNRVIPVLVIVSVLALFVRITSGDSLFGMIGFIILFMLPVALISSRIMWKKGIIKVVDNDETASEKAE